MAPAIVVRSWFSTASGLTPGGAFLVWGAALCGNSMRNAENARAECRFDCGETKTRPNHLSEVRAVKRMTDRTRQMSSNTTKYHPLNAIGSANFHRMFSRAFEAYVYKRSGDGQIFSAEALSDCGSGQIGVAPRPDCAITFSGMLLLELERQFGGYQGP